MATTKIVVKDPEEFAKKYPKLVRPDTRKIQAALDLGFEVDGIEFVEVPDREETKKPAHK